MIGAMVSIGIVTGPTVGGLILQYFSWRWIFFLNLPIGIVGTVLAIRYIPDTPPQGGLRPRCRPVRSPPGHRHGLVVLFASFLLIQTIGVGTTAAQFALVLAPVGLGMGIFQSPNNSAIMGSVPTHQLGVAGGMLGLNRPLGQIFGFAILVTFWASRIDAISPGSTAPEVEAVAFHHTNLGGAAIVLVALSLSIWTLRRHLRAARKSQPVPRQPSARWSRAASCPRLRVALGQ